MQQDNNHIENKLRQLENQQLPDLSQMDAHWQQMGAILSPGSFTVPKTSFLKTHLKKLLFAACIIAALMIAYVAQYNAGKHTATPVAGKNSGAEKNTTTAVTTNDTNDTLLSADATVTDAAGLSKMCIKKIIPLINKMSAVKELLPLDINSTALAFNHNYLSIGNFYNQIQKQAQQFIINSATGGFITAGEGTTIQIPPVAFVDGNGQQVSGNVTIYLEEYYKYSDMIAANLTTTSNKEQLVTGGMIRIIAVQNNKPVELRNNKPMEITMPTTNYDAEMRLFLADEKNEWEKIPAFNTSFNGTYDVAANTSGFGRKLDWTMSSIIRNSYDGFDGKTNFLSLQDEPVRVRETRNRRIAKFHITNKLPMDVAEAKKVLQEKYGDYYTVIKVKKVKPLRKLFGRGFGTRKYIGDSTRMTVNDAIRWHYIDRKDSVFYAEKVKQDSADYYKRLFARGPVWILNPFENTSGKDTFSFRKMQDSLAGVYEKRRQVEQAYHFTVAKMGWINCDRFYSYPDKTDFVLDLPADVEAGKFVTQLVFTKIRSVMPGEYQKNKIGFMNIPNDMPVFVVGLGERNGKVVSFMQALKTGSKSVAINTLEETTPEAFKEKLKQLDL
ncbi:hypothetical protein [Ferruginibacter sp.]